MDRQQTTARQNRAGIPASLAEEQRFFEMTGPGKADTPKGWNNPESWKTLEEIPEGKYFGYVLKESQMLIDFDHIRNDQGKMDPWAIACYKQLTKYAPTYTETSLSGKGLHMIIDAGDLDGSIPYLTNDDSHIIIEGKISDYKKLTKAEKDTTPKIELFHSTRGRYVYLTGNNTKVNEVAQDEDAISIWRECEKLLNKCHEGETGQAGQDQTVTDEDTKARILDAIKHISSDDYSTWTTIGIALYNSGMPFEVWNEWSKRSDKYDPSFMEKKWKSFQGSSRWNAGTIFRMAMDAGWNQKPRDRKAPRNNDDTALCEVGALILDKDEKGTTLKTFENCVKAISYDPKLSGQIFYNEVAYCIYSSGHLPWNNDGKMREWADIDDYNLQAYLEHEYGLTREDRILKSLDIVARNNAINPIKQALERAHEEWDGRTDHISGLLPDMLGAERNEYTYEVMKLVMLGGISRVYHPGCKYDYVIVLVGSQGIGKSHFLRMLAMDDRWFTDSLNALDTGKAPEQLRGMFIVELAELQSFKKTKDIECIKAFITSQYDNYRQPYSKRTENRPRSCIIAGTTNSGSFLTDTTGNRRYLPITCGISQPSFDMFKSEELTRSEIMQAWGEAMELYRKADCRPTLLMPERLKATVESMRDQYTEENADIGIIQEWLDTYYTDELVCGKQIWDMALRYRDRPFGKREANTIADIMKLHIRGWKPAGRLTVKGYGQQRCYRREQKIIEPDDIPFT